MTIQYTQEAGGKLDFDGLEPYEQGAGGTLDFDLSVVVKVTVPSETMTLSESDVELSPDALDLDLDSEELILNISDFSIESDKPIIFVDSESVSFDESDVDVLFEFPETSSHESCLVGVVDSSDLTGIIQEDSVIGIADESYFVALKNLDSQAIGAIIVCDDE